MHESLSLGLSFDLGRCEGWDRRTVVAGHVSAKWLPDLSSTQVDCTNKATGNTILQIMVCFVSQMHPVVVGGSHKLQRGKWS